MKKLSFLSVVVMLLISIKLSSCGQPYQQPVMVTQPTVVQTSQVDQGYSPYQVYDNGTGGQVVYYTDPILHSSYYLDYAIFMALMNSGGYGGIHNYYMGHRSYLDGRYSYYHTSYHHVYYDSRSDGGARYRRSVPTGGVSYDRPSVPSGRATYTAPSRPSVPSGRSYTPTPSRPSVPSGGSSFRPSSSSSSRSRSVPSGRH